MAKLKYRLALDLGASSIGWCVYLLDSDGLPCGIRRMGVRIFSDGRDPKSLASLAADRRLARQARRRRDRVLKRRRRLMEALIDAGLMPADETARKVLQDKDPYELRAKGLDHPLSLHEFGRALFHLGRKRGFRSSRKDSRDADNEKEHGKVKTAVEALRKRIAEAGCATVGEYLAGQHAKRLPVRARRSTDGGYVLYLQRDMVEDEFNCLWDVQTKAHPAILTPALRGKLLDIILFQRRLRPVQPGYCLFEPNEFRARLCSPLQQRFRMLQELNHLRVREGIGDRALTLDERNAMLALLDGDNSGKPVTWAKLAKAAGLRNAKEFNFSRDVKRTGLKGNIVAALFSDNRAFGEQWHSFPTQTKYALAALVEGADHIEPLRQALLALPANTQPASDLFGKQHDADTVTAGLAGLAASLSEKQATFLANINLPDGYGSLSLKALERIVPELERAVVTYDQAVRAAGYEHHSQFYDGELHLQLPYYGELLKGYTSPMPTASNKDEKQFGRIPNPTVHIGLNQIRQLINALIKRFGHPHEIVIETTREFGLSGKRRQEISREQKDNQDANDKLDAELTRLGHPLSHSNRLKLRLWEELGHEDAMDTYCVYSGIRLSKAMLFSDEVEIDHILPFSRSLHDGIGNKILCTRQANREKGNKTPFEAWGHTLKWEDIVERASRLPGRKPQLFRENALEDFLGDLERHLNDTAYFNRATKQYLSAICPPNCIWTSSGKLTGLIRARFGLSKLLSGSGIKNRDDHRHHALDAAVIGLCDRSMIQRIATAAARAEKDGENRLIERLELPWPSFREDLAHCLDAIVVSHKPDHGVETALHKAGSYGVRTDSDSGDIMYCRHLPVMELRSGNVAPPTGKPGRPAPKVRDSQLRKQLWDLLRDKSEREQKIALAEFSHRTNIRRVMLQQRLGTAIPIKRNDRMTVYRYVQPDENYCRDIMQTAEGKWTSRVIHSFQANQPGFDPDSIDVAAPSKPVMRIRKGDCLALEIDGKCRIYRVAQFTNDGVALAEHHEANESARDSDRKDSFNFLRISPEPLKQHRARMVGINILGYINDPGFRE